jgi:hypothetical protein
MFTDFSQIGPERSAIVRRSRVGARSVHDAHRG